MKINTFKAGIFDELLPGFFGRSQNVATQTNADFIIDLIRNGLILLFVVVILLAVVYSALAGIKFIRSQGNSDEVEAAQGALKNVLIGVAAVFLGVIGVFIISAIFSDTSTISVRDSLACFLGETNACTSN